MYVSVNLQDKRSELFSSRCKQDHSTWMNQIRYIISSNFPSQNRSTSISTKPDTRRDQSSPLICNSQKVEAIDELDDFLISYEENNNQLETSSIAQMSRDQDSIPPLSTNEKKSGTTCTTHTTTTLSKSHIHQHQSDNAVTNLNTSSTTGKISRPITNFSIKKYNKN